MKPIFRKSQPKHCPHCLPIKASRHHYGEKLDYAASHIGLPLGILYKSLYSRYLERIEKRVEQSILHSLVRLGILQPCENIPEERISNRMLIFFKEAKKRGMAVFFVCFLKQLTQYVMFLHKGKYFFYRTIPLVEESEIPINVDSKNEVRKFLSENNFPVPEGALFLSPLKAFEYGKRLGYPLVVKPNSGSLSQHVTCNISDDGHFKEAISIAKKFQPEFIVERHIQGKLFRVAVVNHSHVFICEKKLAHVIGDGVSTIGKLIGEKNGDPKRGEPGQKNATLHKITLSDAIHHLKERGYSLDTVPVDGETVFLHDKYILSAGCDIIDKTDVVHPENKLMFLFVSKKLDKKIIGIDFICEDISRSYREQNAAIIETNSLPYLDMHQFPSEGESQPMAQIVWDEFLKTI